jgi:hypothetical protein
MSRWFRFYTPVVDDPKAQMLAPDLFKHWVNVLCIAAENDGELPALSAVAFKLRLAEPKAAGVLAKLCSFGLLDKTDKGFKPHNWDGRQYKSDRDDTAAERAKRYRDGKRERNASVTRDDNRDVTQLSRPPETEADTDTENKKETRAGALVDDGWPKDFREQFWNRYPHKVGKADAIAKLERARKRGIAWVELMAGVDRYVREKPTDRPWCNPATWINQDRWTDEPAGAVPVKSGDVEIDWEREMERFQRGMPWTKWGGPEPGMAGCKVPANILIKYGYGLPDQLVSTPQLRSMGH